MVHAADDILQVQVHRQEHRARVGQDGDVHAEAALGRQRLGHAHPPVAVERGQAAVLRRGRATRGSPTLARWYIGGLLKHAPAVLAFTNPTVNSYHRLVQGFEAPVNLVYSAGNRSAAIRIPITGTNPKAKRIEFRAPDASGNPYLAFAAQLMAGIDGIINTHRAARAGRQGPLRAAARGGQEHPAGAGLAGARRSTRCEADHEFLLEGNVFTPELIETWIELQDRERDPAARAARPHPFEYELYFSV